MASRIVVDYNILGWGDSHREELLKRFTEVILVGKHPDLPRRAFDQEVAAYCKLHDCDLITADARAYTHFFEAGIKSVKISLVERWETSDADLYLVEIAA
jgi:hypothetical protein